MENTKMCAYCYTPFTPGHGNDRYCCHHHFDLAKKERQKQRRDPVARLISILMENHENLDGLNQQGKTELTRAEVYAFKIDLSLARYIQPPEEFKGQLMLDFGQYALITDKNFEHFKLIKHDTFSTIDPE